MTKSTANRAAPPAPADLSDAERLLWDTLVRDWPSGHFKASDIPLLSEYVRALATAEDLGKRVPTASDISDLKAVLDLRDRESRRAAALARTLRIAPQSRYDRHALATAANSANGQRPWEENPFDSLDKPEPDNPFDGV